MDIDARLGAPGSNEHTGRISGCIGGGLIGEIILKEGDFGFWVLG